MDMILLDTFLNQAKDVKGFMVASLTDRYIVDRWPSKDALFMDEDQRSELEKKLLELRIFNETKEMKFFRAELSKSFLCRVKEDTDADIYFDEWQYLDIDSLQGINDGIATTIGGGKYYLPCVATVDAQVCIRYYLGRYPETGQVRIQDWRCVCFKGVR